VLLPLMNFTNAQLKCADNFYWYIPNSIKILSVSLETLYEVKQPYVKQPSIYTST